MIDLSKTKQKTDEEYFPLIKVEDYPSFSELDNLNISYKEAMNQSMKELGDLGAIFIGYNTAKGNAMGTLKEVSEDQKLETPVAENLMSGLAIGMSFEGFTPVLYFERHDFMLVAMDAIGNHIDKIERISHGEYKVPIIIRAVEAFGGPFYSGPTHHQDFTNLLKTLVSFPVLDPVTGVDVLKAFKGAYQSKRPAIIIERKSRY
jgi:pyruvate dehydrogenase E1 component beta subunit